MKPILSICIPTKNRQSYLYQSVMHMLNFIDNDIEIIISDNSDTSAIESFNNIKFVKYLHTSKKLNMTENFEICLSHVTSKYVIFLGDDDFITPNINKLLPYLKVNDYDCIIDKNICRYWWDDVKLSILGFSLSGKIRFKKNNKCVISKNPTSISKELILNDASTEIKYLPRCYHAVVNINTFTRIKSEYGVMFPGITPDMAYSSAFISLFKHFHSITLGYVVSGTAGRSAGGMGVLKKHFWKISDVPWFSKDVIEQWPLDFPNIACGPTLWAFSNYIKLTTNEKSMFNLPYLYARTYIETEISLKELLLNKSLIFKMKFYLQLLRFQFKRVNNIFDIFNFFKYKYSIMKL